ncbi:MAG: Ig-like domain-containing protein, partial [Acidobacteriota bacterium]
AASDGTYTLAARFNDSGSSIAVPRQPFTVEATHPETGVISAPASGDFTGGGPSATQDLVFSATGLVSGTVARLDGTVASAGTVRLSGGSLLSDLTTTIDIDGGYLFAGLPPATYTLVATIPTGVTGTASATVAAGQETVADITLVPAGTVRGIVRTGGGDPAVDVRVDLLGADPNRAASNRETRTDTAGEYVFPDVPLGTYDVRATEPSTGLATVASVEVFEEMTTTQDLDLVAVGSVVVDATFTDASVAALAPVQIRRDPIGTFFASVGSTDFQGRLVIEAVPLGAYTVRVIHPANPLITSEVSGAITAHAEEASVPVVLAIDQPPTVALVSPMAGDEFLDGATVALAADAMDDVLLQRVDFLVDGEVVASDGDAPYTADVVLTAPDVRSPRSLQAVALDNGGNSTPSAAVAVTVIEDLEPPTVTVTAPADGVSVIEGTSVSVQATAADNVAVDRVELLANGGAFATDASSPYGSTFAIPADYADAGPTNLELGARAFDRAGLSSVDAVNLTVVPDEPPTIELTASPPDLSDAIEGETVTFTATATDDIDADVDLFVDGELRQTRTGAPFTFLYTVPSLGSVVNPIEVVLVARDTQNQTASTAPIRLNVVADTPPTVTLTAPVAADEIVEGTLFTISADATDDLGVTRVDFQVDGQVVGFDTTAPYSIQVRLDSGADLETVTIGAVAADTIGQIGSDALDIIRRDDTVPPAISISSPSPGAIFSVGPSDVAILIDTSGSAGNSCGADIDDDGATDNILKCEIFAAKALLDFLDPVDTQVTVIDFSSSAIVTWVSTGSRKSSSALAAKIS